MTKDKQQLVELIERLKGCAVIANGRDPIYEQAAEAIQSLLVENGRKDDEIEWLKKTLLQAQLDSALKGPHPSRR